MDWLAELLGLPSVYLSTGPTRGGGVIQGTASEAVLTVMIAARDKYLKETLPGPDTVRTYLPNYEGIQKTNHMPPRIAEFCLDTRVTIMRS